MNLERVIAALAPTAVVGCAPAEISDLAFDARSVRPGALFFCVPGSRADGHEFAHEAVANGAVALVVEREVEAEAPQIVVPDVRMAMPMAADIFFDEPTRDLEVVGITGTSGKTTTSYLLSSILEAAGRRPGLIGSIERRIGGQVRAPSLNTPEAIDLQRLFREMLTAGNRSCVLEATSHASAQARLERTRFAALVFTNVSQDHLDFHVTLERYFEAKRRLFVSGVPAAVNVGDAHGRRLADELRRTVGSKLLTFGFRANADLRAEDLELTQSGASFRTAGIGVRTRLRGRFNVENTLAAIAAAQLLGVDEESIVRGIAAVEGVPGRFEPVDEGQPFTVLVDYSHKPAALESVLTTARELATGRLICVFGCGGDRDRGKRPVMGRIASELSDLVIVTSDNPRSEDPEAIIDEILEGVTDEVEVEVDRREAIARALSLARAGDVVVIAGKGHEQGQEFRDGIVPFDDREVARDVLRRLGARA
jgi:UDP-N-acetylmuramoyl-L-alanyl-D-glutamate--2,6-diaminopimelate ligase